jgi:hypothetical protein
MAAGEVIMLKRKPKQTLVSETHQYVDDLERMTVLRDKVYQEHRTREATEYDKAITVMLLVLQKISKV